MFVERASKRDLLGAESLRTIVTILEPSDHGNKVSYEMGLPWLVLRYSSSLPYMTRLTYCWAGIKRE